MRSYSFPRCFVGEAGLEPAKYRLPYYLIHSASPGYGLPIGQFYQDLWAVCTHRVSLNKCAPTIFATLLCAGASAFHGCVAGVILFLTFNIRSLRMSPRCQCPFCSGRSRHDTCNRSHVKDYPHSLNNFQVYL